MVAVCVWKVPPFNPFFSCCSFQTKVLCLIWLHPLTSSRKSSKFNICLLAQSHLCLGIHPKGKVNPRKLAEKIPLNTEVAISYMKVCTESLLQSRQHRKISLNRYHSWTKTDFLFKFFSPTGYSDVFKSRETRESTWVCFLAWLYLGFLFILLLFCWPVGAVCSCRQYYRRGLCEQAAATWRWKNPAVLFASHLLQFQYQSSL